MGSIKKLFVFSALFISLFVFRSTAFADVRDYLVTYPYGTPYKGELELELWNDFNSDKDNPDLTYNRHQIELEYGVTDRYMAGLYAVFFKRAETTKLEEIKFEQRYRLANKGEFIFDPALYIEYIDRNASGKKNILEGKFIISKDFGKLNFTSNLIWEKKLASGEPWEF